MSKSLVKNWIVKQDSYRLHKSKKTKFERNKTIVAGIDSVWQADLADLRSISRENDNYVFLLIVIDVFSKYLWVVPLKNKKSTTVKDAFEKIFVKGRIPKKIHTDQGTEFFSKETEKFLEKLGIKLYYINSEMKAAVAERVIRTLKEKLYRYFTFSQNHRYLENLQEIVDSYNNSYHRSIKTKPILVNKSSSKQIFINLYGYDKNYDGPPKISKYSYKLDDKVLISKVKKTFEKGYTRNWRKEVFIVDKITQSKNIPTYILRDLHGEKIAGVFYEQELQKYL